MKRYDIIIAGGGMAGLSLCIQLAKSVLSQKSILLIDREQKHQNDRTWCFWESGAGPFESIVFRKWQSVEFRHGQLSRLLPIAQYTYKMIRSSDFYRFAYQQLALLPNIELKYATINGITEIPTGGIVMADGEAYTADYVFDSITPMLGQKPLAKPLLQHFKGWVITANQDCFAVDCPRLMDFNVAQHNECRFFYLLPFDARTALVEYTVFGQQLLPDGEYSEALKQYINEHVDTGGYRIVETESGVIPMTDKRPQPSLHQRVIRIGTSGGYTKPSTGYTFQRTQQYIRDLVETMATTGKPTPRPTTLHGQLKQVLDTIFLTVLRQNRLAASDLFTCLFTRNEPNRLFRFMNEESTLSDDLRVIGSLPKTPFALAAIQLLYRRIRNLFSTKRSTSAPGGRLPHLLHPSIASLQLIPVQTAEKPQVRSVLI